MAADIGHQQTDKLLAELEKRITAEYQMAANDVQSKLDDYLRRFQTKDAIWQKRVAAGEVSQAEYAQWRIGQMEVGKRWTAMRDELATEMHNANVIARSMVDGYLPEAYALNMNYATYQIERDGRVDTGFTLYNRDAVERIIRDQPDLLPPPSASLMSRVAAGKDVLWNEGQIQSVMTQAILQGESIPNISKRIARTLGESNHASTIRYARTAVTGAQNAGREAAYQRAQDMGVNLRRIWRATLDHRTRHEHRYLDGQERAVGEPFTVMSKGVEYEIRYPADPEAAGFLIWNCRCRTRAAVEGWDRKSEKLRSYEAIGDMTYEEWLEAKPISHSITKQEEIEKAMRRSYIRELYGGSGDGGEKSQEPTTPEEQRTVTNIFGEEVKWSESFDSDKWEEPKAIVETLQSQFRSKLKTVERGSHQSAGSVQVSGTVMHLANAEPSTVIHEFAHTISMERQTKFGLYDESDFWKEIRRVRLEYRKSVGADTSKWISTYEHADRGVDEFMAEAFTLAELSEMGLPIPQAYGHDMTYANQVLAIIKKYFGW